MDAPAVSIVIPTRNRARYLDVALASLADQDFDAAYEVLVVDDGSIDDTAAVVERAGDRYIGQPQTRGLNAARNTGARASAAPVIAFLDDDVFAPREWLRALRDGVNRHSEFEAFGGPIHARFEGRAPSSCGREKPPITTLDLGPRDREADAVWGANLAVRRAAFERVGPFDEAIGDHGDEEEWLLRLRGAGGRIAYLAAAGVDHRRVGDDAHLLSLSRAAYRRGQAARRSNERRGIAPSVAREARDLAGCAWHLVRYGCPQGAIMGAQSAGRLTAAVRGRRAAGSR